MSRKIVSYLQRYGWRDLGILFIDFKARRRGNKAAFTMAMNKKAASIGASSALFQDPSGLKWSGSSASANDILHILLYAAKIPEIAEKWGKATYNMSIRGHNPRIVTITTTLTNKEYNSSKYPIVGGKTGTITAVGHVNFNLAWITTINGIKTACVLMGDTSDESRWKDAENIVEYLDSMTQGDSSVLTIDAPRFASCRLPSEPFSSDHYGFDLIASKSPDETGIPASLTKLMALVTAYDYIGDENEMVRIVPSDLIGGSGNNLSVGDLVSIRDLVYDMLLTSSNDAAIALARHIGGKILTRKR